MINMDDKDILRRQLLELLKGGNAHMGLDDAVKDFPIARINDIFPNGTYSSWHLLEHIRLSQADILEFIASPSYKEKKWPRDYWPAEGKKATGKEWDKTISGIKNDTNEIEKLVSDPNIDIYSKAKNGDGQTILREILLVADHLAYHIGEFAIMRQVMGTWGKSHE
jgi:hypothetical protein